MRALPDAIIRGTLRAASLRRPDWLRAEGPPDPADVPAWLAVSYGTMRGDELLPGPLLGLRDDLRVTVDCRRPRLRDIIRWWPLSTLPEDREPPLESGDVPQVSARPTRAIEHLRDANDDWSPVVDALGLAWDRARAILSESARVRARASREADLRAAAEAAASPGDRARILADARKQRHRARTGEGVQARASHAEGVFVLTTLVASPGLPLSAIGQIGRWLGVLPPTWSFSRNEGRRLELLADGRCRSRRPPAGGEAVRWLASPADDIGGGEPDAAVRVRAAGGG